MRVLALSEHFLPRVGGTTHYVTEVCSELANRGLDLHLVVPGPRPEMIDPSTFPYQITWLDAGYPERGDPSRSNRYAFCSMASELASKLAVDAKIDVVHVLFGLFLMEILNTEMLEEYGVLSVATVHNVPPLECARSWNGDRLIGRILDAVRVRAVSLKNNVRLRRYEYDKYVTPSSQVKGFLEKALPQAAIEVISHGVSAELVSQMSPPKNRAPSSEKQLHLLTMGGWAPHKRQHLIPQIAERLSAAGIEFRWRVAGPVRNSKYKAAVDAEIRARNLGGLVQTSGPVQFKDVPKLYDAANIYVQPSIEEGFCFTALDAAAGGLPVIGSPAGELPGICGVSGGRLVESDTDMLSAAILDLLKSGRLTEAASGYMALVRERYSWTKSVTKLHRIYSSELKLKKARENSPASFI